MNQKKALKTKTILANTLLDLLNVKPFSNITVNELCGKSMIGRSTFYLHFQDKYDLLSYCLEGISEKWDDLMKTQDPKDFITVLLTDCQEKERIFYHLFKTERDEELIEIFYRFLGRYITQCLEAKLAEGALLPGPIDALTAFYVNGLTGMVLYWIKSNYKLPKEKLASCQYRLIQDIL